jgi:hypothetical protein
MNVEYKKDEIYYYIIKFKDSPIPGIVKLKALKDYEDIGISMSWEILNIFTKEWVGWEDRIKIGQRISANELQGVAGSGPSNYIFKDPKEIIRRFFN